MIKKNEKARRELKPIESIEVIKVTYVAPDPSKTRILFNGIIDGKIFINTMSYVEIVKDGKEMHFVSMPSEKGRDGKYYNVVNCFVTDNIVESVRKQIEEKINEE